MPPKGPSAAAVGAAPAVSTEDRSVTENAQVSVSEEGGEVLAANVTRKERKARLRELREQIASGTYKPDAREVAAKILEASLRGRG